MLDVLHHLVLPTVTLGLVYLAQYSRLARSSMLDVLGSDFIRTARAKGLAERVVLYKHALRNALLPVVTVLGLQFGNVLAGAILVETVFNWPGLGPAGLRVGAAPRLPDHPRRAAVLVDRGDRDEPAHRLWPTG